MSRTPLRFDTADPHTREAFVLGWIVGASAVLAAGAIIVWMLP